MTSKTQKASNEEIGQTEKSIEMVSSIRNPFMSSGRNKSLFEVGFEYKTLTNRTNREIISNDKNEEEFQSAQNYQEINYQQNNQEFNFKMYDIKKFEDDQEINLQKFKDEMNELHFRKKQKSIKDNQEIKELREYSWKELIFGTSIPGHFLWRTSKKTAVDEAGVGVTLYFKGLKHLIWNYLFMSILSIPIIIFCLSASKASNQEVSSLSELLQATTIGNIDLDSRSCFKGSFTTTATSFQLECNTGTLSMIDTLNWGYITSEDSKSFKEQDCLFINDLAINKEVNQENEKISKINECEGKSTCTFTLADISALFKTQLGSSSYFFVNSYCEGTLYQLGSKTIQKKQVFQIIALTDLIIIVWYLFMICMQKKAEKKSVKYILKNNRTPSDFSIQISNLPDLKEVGKKGEFQFMAELKDFIENTVNEKGNSKNDAIEVSVIDIKINETQGEIQQQREKGMLYKENLKEIQKFIKKFQLRISDQVKSNLQFFDLQNAVEQLEGEESCCNCLLSLKRKFYLSRIKKNCDQIESLSNVEKGDKKVNSNPPFYLILNHKVQKAWVTFKTIEMKKYALNMLSKFQCPKMFLWFYENCKCFNKQQNLFDGKIIQVKNASNPETFNWENFDVSFPKLKKTLSWIVTILVLIGSYALIMKIQSQQEKINIDCSQPMFENITSPQNLAKVVSESEHSFFEEKEGYVQCYCQSLINQVMSNSLQRPYQDICNDWLKKSYPWNSLLVFVTIMILIGIDKILGILFDFFSNFEKWHMQDEELASNIVKLFVSSFLNSGLTLLLTSLNFGLSENSKLRFIFGGSYNDLSPDWFQNIGTVILLSIFFGTFSYPFWTCVSIAWRYIKLFWDRCITIKFTRKKYQDELVDFYTGDEFDISGGYSSILSICFIGMLYSGGLPILYFISLFQLILQYWIDKILLFKFCKKPNNYNQKMQDMVNNFLYFVPFVHCIFSVFVYGNTDIFYEKKNASENLSSQKNLFQTFYERLLYRKQNYSQLIALIFMILLFLFHKYLIKLYKMIKKCCCCKKKQKKGSKTIKDTPFFSYLDIKQLEDEQKLIRYYNHEFSQSLLEFQKHLSNRFEECEKEIRLKNENQGQENEQKQDNDEKEIDSKNNKEEEKKLIGVFSYDIRHNSEYKEYYFWEKLTSDPNN